MAKPMEDNESIGLPHSPGNMPIDSIAMDVKNLSKVFYSSSGKFVALKGINFLVKKGEFVSVVGPSGSGKSTLLNILGALDRPTSGKIYINGIDIFALRNAEIADMRNKLIGFIFQSFNLINRTTVQKNVEIPAIIAGLKDRGKAPPITKTTGDIGN